MAINLLPSPTKENLKYEEASHQYMFVCELALAMLVLCALALFGETLYADSASKNLDSRIRAASARTEAQELTQFQQRLRLMRDDVERLNRIQLQHPNHTQALSHFMALLPDGIRLTAFTMDLTDKKMILFSGIAQTRADLLALRERLQQDPAYADVNFPLANLLKETNIAFTISLTIAVPAA